MRCLLSAADDQLIVRFATPCEPGDHYAVGFAKVIKEGGFRQGRHNLLNSISHGGGLCDGHLLQGARNPVENRG